MSSYLRCLGGGLQQWRLDDLGLEEKTLVVAAPPLMVLGGLAV